jgi:LmbE family N-acetylglucosaminyl deacetylase
MVSGGRIHLSGQTPRTAAEEGAILVLAPHYDDETLGCGGWLAGLPDKRPVRIHFVCDGRGSPRLRRRSPARHPGGHDRGAIRRAEAEAALGVLGFSTDQMAAWEMPDGSLEDRREELAGRIRRVLDEEQCRLLLIPFRYDRHADHEALNRVVREEALRRTPPPQVWEYFCYFRRRLFPGGDIRRLVKTDFLRRVDLDPALQAIKRRALACYRTQVELGPWGSRALPPALIEAAIAGPEWFFCVPFDRSSSEVWRWPLWRVAMTRWIERHALRLRAFVRSPLGV